MCQNESLKKLLKLYRNDDSIRTISSQLDSINDSEKLIQFYHRAIPIIEKKLWQNKITATAISDYQQLFHELEDLIKSTKTPDTRYNFIIAIPVADRPQHLKACLNSILTLCRKYQYGGFHNGFYTKIRVLISDDSKHIKNINENRELAKHFTNGVWKLFILA